MLNETSMNLLNIKIQQWLKNIFFTKCVFEKTDAHAS